MIPLTVENSVKIKAEPCENDFLESKHDVDEEEEDDEEDCLNSSLTAMDWLPKLNARAGVVEEYVPEEERKPPYSYASLIRLAILNSPGQKATLSDIYKWIQEQFLYYKNQTNLGWKNSIRHNLSLNKCFMKVSRSRHDPGKGCYWAINHLFNHDKTPFEKRKKPILLPNEMFKSDINELQKSFLQTIQARQLQILLSDPANIIGTNTINTMNNVTQSLPPLQPINSLQSSNVLPQYVPDKPVSCDQDPCSMLLDDWATTSEADLSQSLTRFMTQPVTIPPSQFTPAPAPTPVNISPAPDDTSVMDTDTEMSPPWQVKTESSMFNCVDPTEIQNISQKHDSHVSPAPEPLTSDQQEPCKLPSLWSDLGRMSWLGANLDLFDWGRLREVPGHDNCDTCDSEEMTTVDFDQLL